MSSEQSKLGEARIAAALAAQQGRAQPLPKRFFTAATIDRRDAGYAILLDGRPARTPARRELMLPAEAAAAVVADEWNRLGDVIDPAEMPLTRMVNSAIDGVADQAAAVFDEVANYAASDLLVYRAAEPERLVEAQSAAWDPVLDLFRGEHGARFILAQGIMPVAQPPATLSLIRQAIAEAVGRDAATPFRLAGLNVMTTLTGSALLALAVAQGRISAETAWAAAHVDEHFQESQWGQDAEALARRQGRWRDMQAAATLVNSLPVPL